MTWSFTSALFVGSARLLSQSANMYRDYCALQTDGVLRYALVLEKEEAIECVSTGEAGQPEFESLKYFIYSFEDIVGETHLMQKSRFCAKVFQR